MGEVEAKHMSEKTLDNLNKLFEKELDKLFDICGVGILNSDEELLDKHEKILILSTEPEAKIKEGLIKLRKNG